MKKICFVMSMMLSVILFSCSSDENDVVDVQEKRETPQKMLKHLNESNPMSSYGIAHNDFVDVLMATADKSEYTRSGTLEDSIAYCLSVRSQTIQEYANSGDVLMDTVQYGNCFNDVIVNHRTSTFLVDALNSMAPSASKAKLVKSLNGLNLVVSDDDLSITSLLGRISTIQSDILSCDPSPQKNMLLAVASIAANSLSYWEEHGTTGGLYMGAWKSAAGTDYVVGKIVIKYLSAYGVYGWVGGSLITACASFLARDNFVDRCIDAICDFFGL